MKNLDLPGMRLFLSLTLQCVQQFLSLGDLGGDNADSVGRGQAALPETAGLGPQGPALQLGSVSGQQVLLSCH